MFSANIGVQSVSERIVERPNVTTSTSSCLQHRNVVSTPHQFVRTRETGNPGADNDYALFRTTTLARQQRFERETSC